MSAGPSLHRPFPVLLPAFLAALSLPATFSSTASAALDNDFNDPKRCAACHPDIFSQWEGSLHAQAAEDGVFRKFYEMVVEEVGTPAVEFCMKCHSPVGVLRGEVPPATGEKLGPIPLKGVFCDFCHTVTAKLNYRSMSQAFANIFYPDGSVTVPVIRMAESARMFGRPAGKTAAAR